jgi:hypothetical protein
LSLLALNDAFAQTQTTFDVTINVDAAKSLGPLRPIWRFFGADEPNYATMRDGEKLIGELGQLKPGAVYFRAHNLLTTGDGTPALKWGSTNAYTEDKQGNPVYTWTTVDRIFDTYLARGVRPYVEIGFMPQALSVQPEPYRQDWRPGFKYEAIHGGWAFPPKDYAKWGELVFQWVVTVSSATAALKWSSGISKLGTRRITPLIGTAHLKSSTNCTTMRSTPCVARCRLHASVDPMRRAAAKHSWTTFSRMS